MASEFVGKYRSSVLDNRVRIPAKFRDELGNSVIAAPGTDGCFILFPKANTKDVLKNYMGEDPYFGKTDEMREFCRWVMNSLVELDIDSQGRFSLNPVKEFADGINGSLEMVFSGAGNYVEVWPAKIYDKRYGMSFNASQFNSMIASLKATLSNKQ